MIDLKKSFLTKQIRILDTPLKTSHDWRRNASASEEGNLKEKAVQEVVHKCTPNALNV